MPRMKILNSVEREVFDWPPIFNSVQRKRCFDFPTPLQDIATSLRTAGNQLVFLLSCGYFKATKRFYPVPTFHRRDLTYVADLQLVEARYRLLKPVLDHLTLGQDGIQYYAYGVIKAQIFQLTRRTERERYLHLIAFIAHQYYRLHDNLVDVLLTSLQSFHNSALREHKDQCYVRREQRNESILSVR